MVDYDDLDVLTRFIDSIGAQVGPGQTHVRSDDEAVEWRGTSRGHAVRIHVDMLKEVELSAKLPNPHATLLLMFDPEMVPAPNGSIPPWDDRDIVRVFVGRGTFVYAKPPEIDAQLAVFGRLPADLTRAIIDAMQKTNIRYVKLHADGIDAGFRQLLPELADAAAKISVFAQFLGWAAAYLASVPGPPQRADGNPTTAVAEKMTCRFCSSLFVFGHFHACPNCGAPPKG